MISIDNLRFDCIGFQPDKRELIKHDVLRYLETPTLDRLAERSLCFTQCISTNTYTTSSHASILTGLYPPRHGVRAFFETKLSGEVKTIAEMLRAEGYRTILYTDIPDLFVPLDLHRGFEFVRSRNDMELFSILNDLKDGKIFLFVHFFDVHEPFLHNTNEFRAGVNEDYLDEIHRLYEEYGLQDSFDRDGDKIDLWNGLVRGPLGGRPIDVLLPLYVKGITKFDKGRFHNFMTELEVAWNLDEALVAIFSDHGEGRCSFVNKTYLSHGGDLYDNVLRVPFMISCRGLTRGSDDKLMSTVDALPAMLELLNIDYTNHLDGVNILSSERENTYCETWSSEGTAIYATSEGQLRPDSGKWPTFKLHQMALRTQEEKFIQWNKGKIEDFAGAKAIALGDEEFVRKLYRDILGRSPEAAGFEYYVDVLKSRSKTRMELAEFFLNSEEYLATPHAALYQLKEDSEENAPLDPLKVPMRREYLDSIERVLSKSVFSEAIFPLKGKESAPSDEELAIITRLKDLGYL